MGILKRKSLQSEVIEYIKKYIEDNNLKDGDRIPSQENLGKITGVSRSTIREAVRALEAKGVLEVVNGKGIYVQNTSSNIIAAQIEFKKEKESILELLEARKILEREIIHLVIQYATDDELDEIEKLLNDAMAKYYRGESNNIQDREFHLAIYSACHNRIMNQLILSVDELLEKIWNFPLGMEDPFTRTMPLHRELFDKIRSRNVKKAQSINDKIINMVYEEVKSV